MKFLFLGPTSVVSRIHFELILFNGTDFQLKCLSKNGIFINNNYLKVSSISVLPKQYVINKTFCFLNNIYFYIFFLRCTLRFPSTDMCISFSSLINNNNNNTNPSINTNSITRTSPESISRHVSNDASQPQQQQRLPLSTSSLLPVDTNNSSSSATATSSLLLQSVPNITQQQQQVILVAVNQHPQRTVNQTTTNNNHESSNSLPSINLNSIASTNRNNGHNTPIVNNLIK